MNKISQILILSKKLANSLLNDKNLEGSESSEVFDEEDEQYIVSALTDENKIKGRLALRKEIDTASDWKKLRKKTNRPLRHIYYKYAAAAAIVGILLSSYLFTDYSFTESESTHEFEIVGPTVKKGTDKATLTLEDGTNVILNNGSSYVSQNVESNGKEITYQSTQEKAKELEYNYLTIPRGGQFFLKLSDGTKVWLNSETKLKYPVNFAEDAPRVVELIYGEAYFDVKSRPSKDDDKLFIVESKEQKIEVLGTEFNVKAYSDEDKIYSTLIEGKVKLTSAGREHLMDLNEQVVVQPKVGIVEVNLVDAYAETSWKEGVFTFKGKSLEDIMKVISRWYDVNVIFETEALKSLKFKGVVDKNQNIEEILLIMKSNTINNYEIKNDTIIIK